MADKVQAFFTFDTPVWLTILHCGNLRYETLAHQEALLEAIAWNEQANGHKGGQDQGFGSVVTTAVAIDCIRKSFLSSLTRHIAITVADLFTKGGAKQAHKWLCVYCERHNPADGSTHHYDELVPHYADESYCLRRLKTTGARVPERKQEDDLS